MKIIISSFLLLLSIVANAQNESVDVLSKGTNFIGGSMSLDYNTSTNEADGQSSTSKNTGFGIGPVAGKYIRENLAIGLGLGYGFSKYKNEYYDNSENESKSQYVSVNFFLRKNFKIIPNLFFYIEASSSLSFGFNKAIDNLENESKNNSYSLGLGGSPGLQIFLSKKLSLESSLGYVGYRFTRTDYKDSDSNTNRHQLYLSGGLSSVNFSLRYFF